MTPSKFVKALSQIRMDSVFNPYGEVCPFFDRRNAAEIRADNILLLLNALKSQGVHSLWIGRDLGYRGGRRTGVPLTDEIHLGKIGDAYGVKLIQATAGAPLAERTARIIWQVLPHIPKPVFLWNVFPLHPYEPGHPLSNRCHTRHEREKCSQFLIWLLEMLRPQQVVAIGRDAECALNELKLTCRKVRHPSYGGQNEFKEGIADLYKISIPASSQTVFDIVD